MWRGGSVDSQVTLGGRQVELPRLRVRSADGEVPLVSFQWAAATDPMDEHTLAAVAAGVSTRRYAGTLDPVPADVTERATSSSAVSRRFVALSTGRLQAFLGRPLGELDLRVVCIDGKVFRDHCMVIALGIDTAGRETRRWRCGVAPGDHRCLRFSRRGATLPSPVCRYPDYADVGAGTPAAGGVCAESIGIITGLRERPGACPGGDSGRGGRQRGWFSPARFFKARSAWM